MLHTSLFAPAQRLWGAWLRKLFRLLSPMCLFLYGNDTCPCHGFIILDNAGRALLAASSMLLAASRAIPRWSLAFLRMLLLDPFSLASSFAAGLLPDFSTFPGWTIHATAALALALADYIGVNFGARFASEVAIPHQLVPSRL